MREVIDGMEREMRGCGRVRGEREEATRRVCGRRGGRGSCAEVVEDFADVLLLVSVEG